MADNDITFSRIPADALERWKVVRDVCAGDQALRCDEYLPRLNALDASQQNVDRNKAYRERAVFYPATGFTLAGMIGLAFRLDPKAELPSALQYLLSDADGAGVSLYQQSQSVLGCNVQIGRHGLYTDFSAELKRPIIKSYKAEDITNWRHSLIGGKVVLVMVVLKEQAELTDEYAVSYVDQWREVFLNDNGQCAVRVWQLDEKGVARPIKLIDAAGNEVDQLVLRSSAAPLDYVPFDFVGSQNNDASIDEAPLYGMAKVNVGHFRNSADYEDAAFMHGQSQFWMSGLDVEWRDHLEAKGSMYVGTRQPMLLPVHGACGFAQAEPNMVSKEAMEHKEEQMLSLGARLIQKGGTVKTATQSEGEREASTSILAMCVANTSEAYQRQIGNCARYLDLQLDVAGSYKINQDFAEMSADPNMVKALIGAWQAGIVAKVDVRNFFRRQGTVATERSDEDIDADLKLDPPPVDGATVDANGKPLAATPNAAPAAAEPAAPAPDFGPLLASIGSLVDALGKPPAEPAAPIDFAPLIEGLKPAPAAPPVDLSGVVEAMREQADAIRSMAPPVVNFQAGDVNIAPPAITVEGVQITNTPPGVTVEGSTINVQPAQVIQQRASGVTFEEDAAGNITGAKLT